MRSVPLSSPARNRTMKKTKVLLFVYVAGALTAIVVMMALRGYAPFLFAGADFETLFIAALKSVPNRAKRRAAA